MKKNGIRTAFCTFGAMLCILLTAFCYSPEMVGLGEIPSVIYYDDTVESAIAAMNVEKPFSAQKAKNGDVTVIQSGDESLNAEYVNISIFGIPIKTVTLVEKSEKLYVPSGQCIGVALHTRGVLVVGTGEIITDTNGDGVTETVESPAAISGIVAGDVIINVNGVDIEDTNALCEQVNESMGKLTVTYERDEAQNTVSFSAVFDTTSNEYKLGAWVRDSTAGIGTLSFYSAEEKKYAALGHAIVDIDTNTVFDVGKGRIVACDIVEIQKGAVGTPGELVGVFMSGSTQYGDIRINSDYGMYGYLDMEPESIDNFGMEIACPDELSVGKAQLYSAACGEITAYDCEIKRLFHQTTIAQKGMVIEVTDERLISKTGGIVQGMSGSPIIQNGKIVGVLTHVMVNEPKKGYAMYAFWIAQVMDGM